VWTGSEPAEAASVTVNAKMLNGGSYTLTPAISDDAPAVIRQPLNGDRNLVNFKALMLWNYLEQAPFDAKVGLITSRSGAGRVVQSIGSVAIPGDMSDIRSPVRSTVYEVLTPGGGGGRNRRNLLGAAIGGERGAVRCPAGYEFGGRFATRGFGNCGRRLFDVLGGPNVSPGRRLGGNMVGLLRAERNRVGAGGYGNRTVQIQRNAQIPRVAASNEQKFNDGLEQAVATLANPDIDGMLLVRRDGQILRSAVSANVLTRVAENPDMKDGALVASVADPSALGDEEVPAIWKSGVRSVALALPGGGSIRVSRSRDLSATDKRRLGRVWAQANNRSDGRYDYGLRLRRATEKSNGLLVYEEKFPNIQKPSETVTISETANEENRISVQRWVHETYLAEKAPGRDAKDKTWNVVDVAGQETAISTNEIADAKAAVQHLKNGKPVNDVPSDLLDNAISQSKVFQSSRVRPGVTLLERSNGEKWWRVNSSDDYMHLAERISADVNGALGLRTSTVKFIGAGARRDVLVSHPESDDQRMRRLTVNEMNSQDLLRTVVSDWLVDRRDRNPASLVSVGRDDNGRLASTTNVDAALVGLSTEELKRRRQLVLGDFAGQSFNALAADRFRSGSVSQKKALLELYDDLLKRAANFNWDDYISRLGLDGGLSPGERAHVELVKALYERRLKNLRSSRKQFLSIFGLS
jgi:hypothetical protein